MIPGIVASSRRRAVVPSSPDIGDPFGGGFYGGDIEIGGLWYRLVVADAEADITGADSRWKVNNTSTPNTGSVNDGFANTLAMVASDIDSHPAAKHCVNYRGGGFSDWYFPARDEMQVLYSNLDPQADETPSLFVRKSGEPLGAQAFERNWYYVSTQNSSYTYDAWIISFSNGSTSASGNKPFTNRNIRPIRRVPI